MLIFFPHCAFLDAVESARQSNAEVLNSLQTKLEKINDNTLYLEDRQRTLDKENAKLQYDFLPLIF